MKKKLLSKREVELKDLENFQLSILQKMRKTCSQENAKGMVEQSFDKVSAGVNLISQPSGNTANLG